MLGQCTRRRSSPSRYSRIVTSSVPAAANALGRLSPVPDHSPLTPLLGNGRACGVTVSRLVTGKDLVSSTSPNGSLTRTAIGPLIAAADVRPDRVGDLTAPAWTHLVHDEPRPCPQDVGHLVLQQQHAGRHPSRVLQPQRHRDR